MSRGAAHERPPRSVDEGDRSDGAVPTEVRLAAGVVLVQALGLLVAAVVLVIKTVAGHPDSVGRSLWAAGFALLGALILAWAARSISAGHPGLRSPLIVIELLALPVGYSLGIQAGKVEYGAPVLLTALAVLYLLFTPAARESLQRRM
jgi:hypothetical protein